MGVGLALLAALVALYAVVATKLGRWSITGPMVFVAIGFLLGPRVLGVLILSSQAEVIKSLTEITLALLLFADASTLNLRQIREDEQLPARLLTIGMLLTLHTSKMLKRRLERGSDSSHGTVALGGILVAMLLTMHDAH
jgi:NhaP-type Na+/H+ or K+/H+ antiporter